MSGQQRSTKAHARRDLTDLESQLGEFYSKKENAERVLPVLNRVSPVSLRLLEYFVVNFSKHSKVLYRHHGQVIDVHDSYEAQLKTYHKAFFDPFKRSEKRTWDFAGQEKHDVTLGQLCFLKWVVVAGILDYLEANLQRVAESMKSYLSRPRDEPRQRENSGRRSRTSRKKSPVQVTAVRARALVGDRWVIHFD
jgi:hypothetical protein